MNNKLMLRHEELCTHIVKLRLDFISLEDCINAARELVGLSLSEGFNDFEDVGRLIYARAGLGRDSLEACITELNNLPIGLEITAMQRAEAIEGTDLENDYLLPGEDTCPNLDQLEQSYQEEIIERERAQENINNVTEYVFALENLVSRMQGKSFTDSSKISALEADNAELMKQITKLRSQALN